MSQIKLNIDESKALLRHVISNNQLLQNKGLAPIAVELEGDSGLGKTSAVLQLGEELGLSVVKLNLSQIEEIGDLVGFPIRQFQVCKDAIPAGEGLELQQTNCVWVDEPAVDEYTRSGYRFTGLNRMSYCPPEWIAGKEEGGILILDDWSRADVRFIQAVMELIDRQTYISWKLPKNWHIILTANPDNGDYLVNATDNAQKTRFLSVQLMFNADIWAKWAENTGIDGRCINFLLKYPETINKKVNARSAVMFFNSLFSIKDFEKELPLIQMLGEGTVGPEFTTNFTTFIHNKLDKLTSPKDILFKKYEDLKKELDVVIGERSKQNYRNDIASILCTRFINYTIKYAEDNKIDTAIVDRIEQLVLDEVFTSDLNYHLVKNIIAGNRVKFKMIPLRPKLVKYILA